MKDGGTFAVSHTGAPPAPRDAVAGFSSPWPLAPGPRSRPRRADLQQHRAVTGPRSRSRRRCVPSPLPPQVADRFLWRPPSFKSAQATFTVAGKGPRLNRPTAQVPSASGRAQTSAGVLPHDGRPACPGVLIDGQHLAVGEQGRVKSSICDMSQPISSGAASSDQSVTWVTCSLGFSRVRCSDRTPADFAHDQHVGVVPVARAGIALMSGLGEADRRTCFARCRRCRRWFASNCRRSRRPTSRRRPCRTGRG